MKRAEYETRRASVRGVASIKVFRVRDSLCREHREEAIDVPLAIDVPPSQKKIRAFGAILLLCLLFSSVQFMFLTPKTIVLDLLYYFLSLWRSFPSEYASGYHRTAREKNSPQSKHCCHKTLANATYRKCLAPEFRLSLSCLKTFL